MNMQKASIAFEATPADEKQGADRLSRNNEYANLRIYLT